MIKLTCKNKECNFKSERVFHGEKPKTKIDFKCPVCSGVMTENKNTETIQ